MKKLIFPAVSFLFIYQASFAGTTGGGSGGMGLIVEGGKELSLRYAGQLKDMVLLKASSEAFDTLEAALDLNVSVHFQDRIVYGLIKEPGFFDAVLIETGDGESLVIIKEEDMIKQPMDSVEN